MNERTERLQRIKEIISEKPIGNQEELLTALAEYSLHVTQATLSRDLKTLRVGKVSDGKRGYYYSLPDHRAGKESDQHFFEDIRRGTISISYSANLVVINTLPGHANTVAFAIDRLEIEEIAGTIAGDDTILVILAEGIGREEFNNRMNQLIPDWERII